MSVRFLIAVALCLLLAGPTLAHMQLVFPAPFNASNNPHRTTAADLYLQYPYDCCGPNDAWTYPCRGYMSLFGTDQGAPTATWAAGSKQSWNISGIGNHFGGSCQVGFSTDKGLTFHVATSYEGNCPHRNDGNGPEGQDFDFTVPSDLEPGVQVFAWIWYNREQEFNMNCAAVEITSGSASYPPYSSTQPLASVETAPTDSSTSSSLPTYQTSNGCDCTCASPINIQTCSCDCSGTNNGVSSNHQHRRSKQYRQAGASIAFAERPLMLVADDGNDCITPRTTAEVKYPDPGPEVVTGDGAYPLVLPSGSCSASDMLLKQASSRQKGSDAK